MLHMRWPYLTAIAAGAGIGIGGMLLLLNNQREKYANQAAFVESAVKKLREQPAALSLLGDNFKVGHASLQDGWGKMNATHVRVRVPIIGKTDNGSLLVYARKKPEKGRYKLFKLEVIFDKVAGKKLILMDLGDDDTNDVDEDEAPPVKEKELDEYQLARRKKIEEQEKKIASLQDRSNHPTLKMNRPTT